MSNEAVEVFVVRSRDIETAAADVVNCFIVDEEGTIGMLNGAVSR